MSKRFRPLIVFLILTTVMLACALPALPAGQPTQNSGTAIPLSSPDPNQVGTLVAMTLTALAPVPGSPNCYVVVPLDATGAFLGRSDMPCLQPSTASPSAAPSNPTLAFDTRGGLSAARLTWGAVAGATGYIVRTFAADGQKYWQGTTGTEALPLLFGASSCYVVFAMDGSNPIGNSHTLCAVADIGNIPF